MVTRRATIVVLFVPRLAWALVIGAVGGAIIAAWEFLDETGRGWRGEAGA